MAVPDCNSFLTLLKESVVFFFLTGKVLEVAWKLAYILLGISYISFFLPSLSRST